MFRTRLKQLREDAGYSQYSLSAAIGVSQSAVGSWESGVRVPKFATLQKLADFFGVSVDYLLGREMSELPISYNDPTGDMVEIIIRGRDGKVRQKLYTRDQMAYITRFLDAISDDEKGAV